MKNLFLLVLYICFFQTVFAQKEYINRKIAQKNYDGYMLMQSQKYGAALLIFNEALEADPEAFFIYQNRAICKLSLGDTTGAIIDFKTNIKLEPQNADSKYALGNIYKHRYDTINTIKYFIPAINHADNEFSQAKLLYMSNFVGHYFRLVEKYDSALIYYNQVKKYTPQNSSVFINSAVCNFQLDSLEQFCSDLEQAFVLGGNVNCIALKSYCSGCTHLLKEKGETDTLSMVLDTRLRGIIPDTIYRPFVKPIADYGNIEPTKKVRVYFNQLWQICLPEKAAYYREAFWAKLHNFFGGEFTDYYMDGNIFGEGRLNRSKLNGPYKNYFRNGNVRTKGQFIDGRPNGKWIYLLENGQVDFEIDFFFDEFKFKIINEANPNYILNSGTGKFKILLDRWGKIEFIITGEYLNNEREGKWEYVQDGQKLIWENYKKGKFKKGFVATNFGSVTTNSIGINASVLIPPQLTQVRNLYFDDVETPKFYPFIFISGF